MVMARPPALLEESLMRNSLGVKAQSDTHYSSKKIISEDVVRSV